MGVDCRKASSVRDLAGRPNGRLHQELQQFRLVLRVRLPQAFMAVIKLGRYLLKPLNTAHACPSITRNDKTQLCSTRLYCAPFFSSPCLFPATLTHTAPNVNRRSPIHLNRSVLMSKFARLPYATDSIMYCLLAGGCSTLATSMGLTMALQIAKAAVGASRRPQEWARPLPLPPGTWAMGMRRAASQLG